MFLAVIREAAEQASVNNGPLHGYPPWLIVLIGAVIAAIALWIFAKVLKWAIWVGIMVVVIGGIIIAWRMFWGA